MTADQWRSVEDLFLALNELPPEQRDAQLAEIIDDDVRNELSSLLQHSGPGDTLATPIEAMALMMRNAPPSEDGELGLSNRQIGPYRLVRRIGQGGMGSVYEAMRVDGFLFTPRC